MTQEVGRVEITPDEPPPPRPAAAGAGGGGRRRGTGRGSDEPPRGPRREPSFRSRWQEWLDFLRSVRAELRRVSWPGWPEVRAATLVVILTLVVVSGYAGIWDWLLTLVLGTPTAGSY